MITFPKQCQIARILMNMTQKELAESMGISNITVSHWETGNSEPQEEKKRLFYTLCDKNHLTFSPTGMPMMKPTPVVPESEAAIG